MRFNRTQRLVTVAAIVGAAALPLLTQADEAPPYLLNPIACGNFLCLLTQVVRILLGGVALIAVTMFIYGGYVFLTSGGNADRVKLGKDTLFWASLGIVVILGSWVAIQYVLRGLAGTT